MKEILKKSLLNKIERLEAFEEKLNIKLENFSIKIEDIYFTIYWETHPVSGTSLQDSIRIECVIYDSNGSILDKDHTYIIDDNFFGFEISDLSFNIPPESIGKIRIYPKKM